MNPPIHIMIDIETAGTKPGCKILTLGATQFRLQDRMPKQYFYAPITVASQGLMDIPDIATMEWWDKQSEEAINNAFHSPNARPLPAVLTQFMEWLAALKADQGGEIYIWGKGASFDEPVLREACRRYGIIPVWSYKTAMCHRTLEFIGQFLGIDTSAFEGIKHHALDDAVAQALVAETILNALDALNGRR